MINYITDPYEIFKHAFIFSGSNHNQRYEKIEYLKNHHQKFDSYLIGSSRVGLIEPKIIESYFKDSIFYNAWMSGANPVDAALLLDYMIQNRWQLKNVYLVIDDNIFTMIDYRSTSRAQRRWHYDISQTNAIIFFCSYLFSFHIGAIKAKLLGYFQSAESQEDIQHGTWSYTTKKTKHKKNAEDYIKYEPLFRQFSYNHPEHINWESIHLYLEKIATQCKNYKINCTTTTAPIHHKILAKIPRTHQEKMLRIISKYFPNGFWHFSYLNPITIDNKNYYEPIHHIEQIDKLMLAKIFNDKFINVPQDFGLFITQENLEVSLQKIDQIEKIYKKSLDMQHLYP